MPSAATARPARSRPPVSVPRRVASMRGRGRRCRCEDNGQDNREEHMVTPEELLRERERIAIAATPLRAGYPHAEVSWPGVWSGVVVATGLLTLLTALGLAVGLSVLAAVPGSAADMQRWSIGAGLWALASLLVSLFVGGLVSTRTGVFGARPAYGVEGMLVWVLSMALVSFAGAVRFAIASVPVLNPPGTTPDTMTTVPQPDV